MSSVIAIRKKKARNNFSEEQTRLLGTSAHYFLGSILQLWHVKLTLHKHKLCPNHRTEGKLVCSPSVLKTNSDSLPKYCI